MPGRRSRLVAAVCLAVALALGGCGATDEERIASVHEEYLAANAAKDHRRICELTTPEHRSERADHERPEAPIAVCVEHQIDTNSAPATPRQKRAVREVEVVDVNVDGDRAWASLRLRGRAYPPAEFSRMPDGEWRYDGAAPAPA